MFFELSDEDKDFQRRVRRVYEKEITPLVEV